MTIKTAAAPGRLMAGPDLHSPGVVIECDDGPQPSADQIATRGTLFRQVADRPWTGYLEGTDIRTAITVIAYGTDEVGGGPRLHVHPFPETFIIVEGRARFFVGDATIDAGAGDVVHGPAGLPHRFENIGPGRLQTIDIHHSPTWIQTNLD